MTDRLGSPLLFLDVDGPLLPFGGSPPYEPEEIVDVPRLARLRRDAGPRLTALPCTLVWATSWLEDANSEIAPRLGLPSLPVVAWPERNAAGEREDIDDEITDADRHWVSAHHPGPALLLSVDASRGLTEQDLAVLGAWLQSLP